MSINQRHLNEFHGWLLKADSSSWRPVHVSNAFVWEAAVCNYPTGRARIREPMYRQLCHTSVPILLFNLISPMPMDVLGHFDRRDRISSLFFCSVCQLTCICVRARTTMISRLKHRVADIEVALRTTNMKKQHQSRVHICYYSVKSSVFRFITTISSLRCR